MNHSVLEKVGQAFCKLRARSGKLKVLSRFAGYDRLSELFDKLVSALKTFGTISQR